MQHIYQWHCQLWRKFSNTELFQPLCKALYFIEIHVLRARECYPDIYLNESVELCKKKIGPIFHSGALIGHLRLTQLNPAATWREMASDNAMNRGQPLTNKTYNHRRTELYNVAILFWGYVWVLKANIHGNHLQLNGIDLMCIISISPYTRIENRC